MRGISRYCYNGDSISKSPRNKEKVLAGFERTISCYNKPEIQDSTETGTADRIWLNLNLQEKWGQTKPTCGETQDWSEINIKGNRLRMGLS